MFILTFPCLALLTAQADPLDYYRAEYFRNIHPILTNVTTAQWITKSSPTIIENWPDEASIYVIADLHGDFDVTLKILAAANLAQVNETNSRLHWTPSNQKRYVIQLGDIADRGPNSPAIYELFKDLRHQSHNDTIIQMIGNHELMLLAGTDRYLSSLERRLYYELPMALTKNSKHLYSMQKAHLTGRKVPPEERRIAVKLWNSTDAELSSEFAELKKKNKLPRQDLHAIIWNGDRGYLGTMVVNSFRTAYQIGDLLLSHAGLHPFLLANATENLDFTPLLDYVLHNPKELKPEQIIFLQSDCSPYWGRELSTREEHEACVLNRRSLWYRNASVQIVGHTPTSDGEVQLRCNQSFILADTANSKHMGGNTASFLKIYVDPNSMETTKSILRKNRIWESTTLYMDYYRNITHTKKRVIRTDHICFNETTHEQIRPCPEDRVEFNANEEKKKNQHDFESLLRDVEYQLSSIQRRKKATASRTAPVQATEAEELDSMTDSIRGDEL